MGGSFKKQLKRTSRQVTKQVKRSSRQIEKQGRRFEEQVEHETKRAAGLPTGTPEPKDKNLSTSMGGSLEEGGDTFEEEEDDEEIGKKKGVKGRAKGARGLQIARKTVPKHKITGQGIQI